MGFIDDQVNSLLALEKEKEASIAMASIDFESIHNLNHEIYSRNRKGFSNILSKNYSHIKTRNTISAYLENS